MKQQATFRACANRLKRFINVLNAALATDTAYAQIVAGHLGDADFALGIADGAQTVWHASRFTDGQFRPPRALDEAPASLKRVVLPTGLLERIDRRSESGPVSADDIDWSWIEQLVYVED